MSSHGGVIPGGLAARQALLTPGQQKLLADKEAYEEESYQRASLSKKDKKVYLDYKFMKEEKKKK
jgi:hypothetical protein